MRQSEPTIMNGWWQFAVRAVSLLIAPPADPNCCDRAVEDLARDSRVGAGLHATSLAVRRAWANSATRSIAASLVAVMTLPTEIAAWRVGGWMIAAVGGTALVLERFAPISNGPLVWMLPAAIVATGIFVMAAAGPLSRAAADRRRCTSSST
ncbi:MAG TPA: hypothetical protein VLV86_14840 [Vicinamibacterales bacterium]|nr:hypothetical protein [Vicinamibacterales bacterium]